MRSAIWSTLVCTANPPRGFCRGVLTREHRDQARDRAREQPGLEWLIRRVRQLLADDAGGDDGPVALDRVDGDVVGEQAAALQLGEPVVAELDESDGRRIRLLRRCEAGHRP